MRQVRWLFAAAFAAATASAPLSAQEPATITGRVTNTTGAAEAAVAVRISTLNVGTTTAADGTYRLVVPGARLRAGQQVTITASRVGLSPASRTVTLSPGATLTQNFQLGSAALGLEGVVVTATGTQQRRREVGNAVTNIAVEDVNLAPVNSVSELLQGRAAGVAVLQSSGTSGTGARIRIRGNNSISLSNEPLLIIDGARVNYGVESAGFDLAGQSPTRLNDLNPEEIESIEILKGPAASALYGTAAANGVIQVTTRRGRAGATRWNVYSEVGRLNETSSFPANYRQRGVLNTGASRGNNTFNCSVVHQSVGTCTPTELLSYNPLEQNSPFREGTMRTVGLNVSGGSERAQFFVSGETQDEGGIYEINSLDQKNLRATVTAQLADNFNIGVRSGYVSSRGTFPYNDNAVEGIVSSGLLGCYVDPAMTFAPVNGVAVDDPCQTDGYYGYDKEKRFAFDIAQNVERFTGSMNSQYRPLSWLSINGTVGMDIINRNDEQTVPANVFTPADDADYPIGLRGVWRALIRTFSGTLSSQGQFDLGRDLAATTTLGANYNRNALNTASAFGRGLLPGTKSLSALSEQFAIGETSQDIITVGVLGSQQLAWRDRLFLTASVRGDRNSAFGSELGFIFYPAASVSWVVADEPWFPETKLLSSLRLRAAYGESGLTPGFRTAAPYFSPTTATTYSAGGVEASTPAVTVGGAGNAELEPERSREFELGFDAGLLSDRLGFELTYYDKVSEAALVSRRLAPSLGSSITQTVNLGSVSNRGLELMARADIVRSRAVNWDASATFSTNQNRLEKLGEGIEPIIFGIGGDSQRHTEGYPLGAYFATPILSYADTSGNGLIAPAEIVLGDSAEYLGTPFPRREISFSSGVTLGKIVRISALVDHKGGHKLLNATEEFRCSVLLQCRGVQDRTAPLGEQARAVATWQRGTIAGFVEDASFTKLREVAVTLSAPTRTVERFNLQGVRLTLSGRNLATWTDYTGLDPELNSGGQSNFSTFDFLGQPPVRHFVARIDLSF